MKLEEEPEFLSCVRAVYFAVIHTFNGAAYKLFENSRGDSFFKLLEIQAVKKPAQTAPPSPAPSHFGPLPKKP